MTPTGWLLIYLALAAVVVFLAIKLSNYVDLLDKKTKLSGALLGGILLAAVTSLPELFTSLTGTIGLGNNQLVLGNIMGSDFFDIIIFGVVYFLFFRKLTEGKVGKQHYYTMFFTLAMVVAVTVAAFVFNRQGWLIGGYFNPMSFAIIAIYIVSVWKTPKTEEKEKEEDKSKLTVKQIWILFAICSVLLIGASIGVTYITDEVVSGFGIGATFGGSLFLGLATSLPEVTATITLCKKKNFDAAYGDIFGSCAFNIIILAIADALSFKTGPLYIINTAVDPTPLYLIIGTVFALLIVCASILFIRSKNFKNNVKSRIILYVFATLLIGSYIAYLVLSNAGITFNL
ncbi:MAG: hypothetical protein MJ222_01665 [Bacilli bacterium]|nr:hypothetical protein [Bacilli bacterium]